MANMRLDLSEEEFMLYYRFAAEHREEDGAVEALYQKLEGKIDKMIEHDLYTQYKCAPTEEEKEAARQEYLDRKGVPAEYRWRKLRGEIH